VIKKLCIYLFKSAKPEYGSPPEFTPYLIRGENDNMNVRCHSGGSIATEESQGGVYYNNSPHSDILRYTQDDNVEKPGWNTWIPIFIGMVINKSSSLPLYERGTIFFLHEKHHFTPIYRPPL
jgi:hypothetical protein